MVVITNTQMKTTKRMVVTMVAQWSVVTPIVRQKHKKVLGVTPKVGMERVPVVKSTHKVMTMVEGHPRIRPKSWSKTRNVVEDRAKYK